jgi:hypothetical protein
MAQDTGPEFKPHYHKKKKKKVDLHPAQQESSTEHINGDSGNVTLF